MSLIQDKLGSEFLRPNGSMDGGFSTSMLMFSHLPPVTSFTRLAAQSVMADLPPQEMMSLKKERESPDCGGGGMGAMGGMGGMGVGSAGGGLGGIMGGVGDYVHAMGIKQEKLPEHDYRLPLYPGGGAGGGGLNGGMGQRNGSDLLELSLGNHQNLLVHDLSMNNQLTGRLGKESTGRKGRKSNGDGTEGKPRRKRGESKALMLDPDGESLSPNSKPHICEHCNAAFRSSYHLRRHVLIHTGERPFRCSQCNMSFIQKYLLQRHEKIHSGEKPFSCDQCNMRFIQKYHMERHKRTHSGEKPYKCDTCQQYFSRTDRLLKHKRTCGEAIKKGVDGALLEAGLADDGQGSYSLTQGNGPAPGRKRAKAKGGEGGERKRRKQQQQQHQAGGGGGQDGPYGLHGGSYSLDKHGAAAVAGHPGPSMHLPEHSRAPKMAFKKGGRSKGLEKGASSGAGAGPGVLAGAEVKHGGADGLGLLQAPGAGAKASGTSSNYDDAMQFLKKRRYLPPANGVSGGVSGVGAGSNVDYEIGVGHLGVPGVGVMDGDGPLSSLLDPSPLTVDLKHDIKTAIPDEVLQSLLEHYTHKSDVTFDLADPHHHPHSHHHPHHHMDLQTLCPDEDAGSPGGGSGGDKTVMMHEYSRFLLQALERTSGHHGVGAFPPPPTLGPSPSSSSSSPSVTVPFAGALYSSDKHAVYGSSPLECGGFGQPSSVSPAASSPSLSSTSSVPKSHFSLLSGSPPPPPQHAFHLVGLEPAVLSQQLTPSQELTEQLDKPHSAASSSSSPPAPLTAPHTPSSSTSAASGAKNGSAYPLTPSQDLAALDAAKSASPYQIENFAQAFGSQFKSGGGGSGGNGGGAGSRGVALAYGTDSGGEVDHRVRTPVSEFSGYTSLLADVGQPVSTGSKTPTSQSYS